MAATRLRTAFSILSKARTSIWRTRSRETPNSAAAPPASSGIREAPRLEDAPLARVEHLSASPSALRRLSSSSLSASFCSGLGAIVDQPVLPFAGIAVLADRCVERGIAAEPAVHIDDVLLGDGQPLGDKLDLVGPQIALLEAAILLLALRRLKNSFFWLAVVPIFTSDHERRTYSWIEALIHHIA